MIRKDKTSNLVYGFHAVESLLKSDPAQLDSVILDYGRSDRRIQNLIRLIDRGQLTLVFEDRKYLDDLCGHNKHQGVAALLKSAKSRSKLTVKEFLQTCDAQSIVLVLDHIQDL